MKFLIQCFTAGYSGCAASRVQISQTLDSALSIHFIIVCKNKYKLSTAQEMWTLRMNNQVVFFGLRKIRLELEFEKWY